MQEVNHHYAAQVFTVHGMIDHFIAMYPDVSLEPTHPNTIRLFQNPQLYVSFSRFIRGEAHRPWLKVTFSKASHIFSEVLRLLRLHARAENIPSTLPSLCQFELNPDAATFEVPLEDEVGWVLSEDHHQFVLRLVMSVISAFTQFHDSLPLR